MTDLETYPVGYLRCTANGHTDVSGPRCGHDGSDVIFSCPNCERLFDEDEDKFCKQCGQRFPWVKERRPFTYHGLPN